jgi:hypothetical protein
VPGVRSVRVPARRHHISVTGVPPASAGIPGRN